LCLRVGDTFNGYKYNKNYNRLHAKAIRTRSMILPVPTILPELALSICGFAVECVIIVVDAALKEI
jgi:hypothetical protein